MIPEDNKQNNNSNFDFSKFSRIDKKNKIESKKYDLFKSTRSMDKKTKLYFIIVGICVLIILILSFLSLSKAKEILPLDYNRPAVEQP